MIHRDQFYGPASHQVLKSREYHIDIVQCCVCVVFLFNRLTSNKQQIQTIRPSFPLFPCVFFSYLFCFIALHVAIYFSLVATKVIIFSVLQVLCHIYECASILSHGLIRFDCLEYTWKYRHTHTRNVWNLCKWENTAENFSVNERLKRKRFPYTWKSLFNHLLIFCVIFLTRLAVNRRHYAIFIQRRIWNTGRFCFSPQNHVLHPFPSIFKTDKYCVYEPKKYDFLSRSYVMRNGFETKGTIDSRIRRNRRRK